MRTKKRFGQHLLRYPADARRIARLLAAPTGAPPATILEIGPGAGALTAELLAEYPTAHIVAVEFDRDMLDQLRRRFTGEPRLELVSKDILTYDPTALGTNLAVVGNLPYNISSPIIEWTVANRQLINRAVFMLQREVAARLTSGPGSKDWSPLAIMTQLYYSTTRELTLPPERFTPPPRVHSAVVSLVRADALDREPPRLFERTVRSGFASRRKLMTNNLTAAFGLSKERCDRALRSVGLAPNVRAEQVTLTEFVALAEELARQDAD